MTFRFTIEPSGLHVGDLTYSDSEYSFDFVDEGSEDEAGQGRGMGVASLSIGTLQIEIDIESRSALHVWGLHPQLRWLPGAAQPTFMQPGTVRLITDVELLIGSGYTIADVGEWVSTFDRSTGWVRVAPKAPVADDGGCLFASDIGIGLLGDKLNSVWLRPRFIR